MIGRQHLVRSIETGLAEAEVGWGRTLLVVGEDGIGKTLLADTASELARERGAIVLRGSGAGNEAFSAWLSILREAVAAGGSRPRRALRRGLRTLTPELFGECFERAPGSARPESRCRFFEAAAEVLASAAERAPLLIAVDDLDRADTASVQLFGFLANELAERRVLLLGLACDEALAPGHPLAASLDSVARSCEFHRLHALSGAEVTSMMATRGVSPASAPETRRALRCAGGNPLRLQLCALPAPSTVAEGKGTEGLDECSPAVVEALLGALSPACREWLEAASVAGERFDPSAVARVLGIESEGCSNDLLEEASRAGLLIAESDGRARFLHRLVQREVLDGLASARRVELHARFACVLESGELAARSGRGRMADLAPLARQAEHCAEAAQRGDARPAIEALSRYAARLAARCLWEEAAVAYQRALDLHAVHAERRPPSSELAAQRCELLVGLGGALSAVGAWERARALRARRRSEPGLPGGSLQRFLEAALRPVRSLAVI